MLKTGRGNEALTHRHIFQWFKKFRGPWRQSKEWASIEWPYKWSICCTLTGRQFVRFYTSVWGRGRSARSQFHTVSWISSFSHDSKLLPGESWHRWEIRHTPYTLDLMPAKFLLLPNRRTTLEGWWLQDTESIRNCHHMKYSSFKHLQWLCRKNVRKIQKACCSQGRALWTIIPPTCICSTDWTLELFVWPSSDEWYESTGEEAAVTVFTLLPCLH